jgi:anti-sigma factor RsiW
MMDSTDSPLHAERQAEFDAHLLSCPDCVERMKEWVVAREAARGVRETERDSFPPLPERLVERILSAARSSRDGRSVETA